MKVALFFLACVVVVKGQLWNPLAICQSDASCPDTNRYCCRSNSVLLGLPVCEMRPHLGWPCDVTLQTSCECVQRTVCYKGVCVLETQVPEATEAPGPAATEAPVPAATDAPVPVSGAV